jgi:hypothetical protein
MSKEVTINKNFSWAIPLCAFFVWLKVENKIDWSWWWVFAPLWMPICIVLAFLIIFAVIAIIVNK